MGYNIFVDYISDANWRDLLDQISLMRTSLHVMIDTFQDGKGLLRTFETLKRVDKDTAIVYRPYEGNNVYKTVTARDWVNKWKHLANTGVYVQADNEPDPCDESFKWLIDVATYATQAKLKVVLGNFSVGRPDYAYWTQEYPRRLLRLIAYNPTYLKLGLHEYFNLLWTRGYSDKRYVNEWPSSIPRSHTMHFVGRFREIVKQSAAFGTPLPNKSIFITETGPDVIHALPVSHDFPFAGGVRSSSHVWSQLWGISDWQRYLFDQMQRMFNTLYYPEPSFGGMAMYAIHSEGQWEDHDLWSANFFRDYMTKGTFKAKDYSMEVPIPGSIKEMWVFEGLPNYLNLRKSPDLTAQSVKKILPGKPVEVYVDSKFESAVYGTPTTWMRAVYDGVEGWFANIYPHKIYVPKPDQSVAIEHLQSAAALIQKAIDALKNTV